MFNLTFDKDIISQEHCSYKLDRISPSMVGLYLTCPLAFYYGYIAKIQIPQAKIHLLFGSSIHKALEDMYNGKEDPAQSFKDMFKKEDLDDEGKLRFTEFYLLGLEMIKNYIDLNPTLNALYDINEGHSEERFKRYIINPITGEPSSVPLSGVLDRRTISDIIVDFKTSATLYDVKDQKFQVQFLLYNLWFYSQFGRIATKTVFLILLKKYKKTKRDEVIQILEATPTLEELAEAWYEVECILDKIENGHFERGTKNHPTYCDCYKYERFLGIR